jgi:hypothetical protein
MPLSPHSAARHLEENQAFAWPTVNGAINRLDDSMHGLLEKALVGDDYTLTSDLTYVSPASGGEIEQAGYIRVTGAFASNRTLTLPNNNDAGDGPRAKFFTVEHAGTGGFTLTVTTVGGTGVTIAQGNVQALYCDGENVIAVAPVTGSGGGSYDIALQKDGLPPDGAVIFTHLPTRSFTLPISFANSRFALTVAPTGAIAFSVRKNGVEVGTINFAIGATTATFTAASATTFTSVDTLTLVTPSPQDATASTLVGTLKGTAS